MFSHVGGSVTPNFFANYRSHDQNFLYKVGKLYIFIYNY